MVVMAGLVAARCRTTNSRWMAMDVVVLLDQTTKLNRGLQ